MGELTSARQRLVGTLNKGAAEKVPEETARAQTGFDCWMQEQEENFQPNDIEACRSQFYSSLEFIEDTLKPKPIAKNVEPPVAPPDKAAQARVLPQLFMPKGQIDLETQVIQSVTGPIGLPGYQARYIPAATKDGKPMNAQQDYVLKMSKDELPPAMAFWSLTLYDHKDGFFIPNDRKKYSLGENAGFKLNADGGIEIYISAKQPEGAPDENWLPINRQDIGMDAMLRIYAPDAEKMKTWKTPQLEMLPAAN